MTSATTFSITMNRCSAIPERNNAPYVRRLWAVATALPLIKMRPRTYLVFRLPDIHASPSARARLSVRSGEYFRSPLAFAAARRYNYVMRSTRDVVNAATDRGRGHYSDPPLLVLASLAGGPKHGHAMIEDIASLCGTRLGPGTLYGAITRLEAEGLIEPLAPEERRRPYRITVAGGRVLCAQLATLQQFVRAGTKRLKFI